MRHLCHSRTLPIIPTRHPCHSERSEESPLPYALRIGRKRPYTTSLQSFPSLKSGFRQPPPYGLVFPDRGRMSEYQRGVKRSTQSKSLFYFLFMTRAYGGDDVAVPFRRVGLSGSSSSCTIDRLTKSGFSYSQAHERPDYPYSAANHQRPS